MKHKVKHVKHLIISLALSIVSNLRVQVPFELPMLLPLSPLGTEEVGADVLR